MPGSRDLPPDVRTLCFMTEVSDRELRTEVRGLRARSLGRPNSVRKSSASRSPGRAALARRQWEPVPVGLDPQERVAAQKRVGQSPLKLPAV